MKKNEILLANILDKYKKNLKTGITTSTNFLNEEEFIKITKYLDSKKIKYNIYSPYEFLNKKIIYFGEINNFISFYKGKISDDITHSNILGTLFSLGIEEDLIGDIIVEDGYFYLTNLTRMNSFLENNFLTVKKYNINLEKVEEITLLKKHYEEFNILTSSMRLDTVVSKITNLSRNNSVTLIKDKKVLLNYELVSTKTICKTLDILSIRKYGKYKIGEIKGKTKKGNIILEIIKYT